MDLLKFKPNKIYIYIKWSCSLSLQPSLLPKFNYVGPKKYLGWLESYFTDKKKS